MGSRCDSTATGNPAPGLFLAEQWGNNIEFWADDWGDDWGDDA